MNDNQSSLAKDIAIIIFIFVVILSVVLIFYTEYVNNQKIRISKNKRLKCVVIYLPYNETDFQYF